MKIKKRSATLYQFFNSPQHKVDIYCQLLNLQNHIQHLLENIISVEVSFCC